MSANLASTLFSAITRQENINPSLNNPGGLMDIAYYKSTGQFRLMQYSTPEAGIAAGTSLVQSYIDRGYNLDSMIAAWAPAGHGANDPITYAQNVGQWTGLPTDTPLNLLQGGGQSIYTNDYTGAVEAATIMPPATDWGTVALAGALVLGLMMLES